MATTWSFRLYCPASSFLFNIAIRFPDSFRRRFQAAPYPLELESCFTRRIGQRLDAPVVQIAATIEDHLLDALLFRALGDELANLGGGDDVATVLLIFGLLSEGRGGGEGNSVEVVDELRVDVVERAVDVGVGARRYRTSSRECGCERAGG